MSVDLRSGLLQFDRLEPLDAPNETNRYIPKRMISLVGCVGSIALRLGNFQLWSNAVGCFGAGATFIASITIGQSPRNLARIRQVAMPLLGQVAIFGFSQAWANTQDRSKQIVYDNVIMGLFGANVQLILGWLFQQGAIRTENHAPLKGDDERKLNTPSCIGENGIHTIKTFGALGLGVLSFLGKDSILKQLSGYFFPFFLGQVIGERSIRQVDIEIEKRDQGVGTPLRRFKTALLTTAYIAQLLNFVFMPWHQASAIEKVIDLRVSGAVLGLADGVLDYSLSSRAINLRVEDLEELKRLPEPKKPLRRLAYRIWHVALPVIALSGITAFTIWQNNFVLQNEESKIALGSMLGGFLSGTLLCKAVDVMWDASKRGKCKDKLMSFIWYSPRLWGINPVFLYYGLINAIKIDADSIESQSDKSRLAAMFFAWFCYGYAMGRELVITSSERLGSLETKIPRFALFNSAMTLALNLTGQN